jgi:hypothetical protein
MSVILMPLPKFGWQARRELQTAEAGAENDRAGRVGCHAFLLYWVTGRIRAISRARRTVWIETGAETIVGMFVATPKGS